MKTPAYSVVKLVAMIKNLTARHIFYECPQVKISCGVVNFWSDGFFANKVNKHGDRSET